AARHSRAAENADTHLHGGSPKLLPLSIKSAKLAAHTKRGTNCIDCILLNIRIGSKSTGKAEHGHDRVAHIFIDESAALLNVACERLHIIVNPLHYLRGLEVF